MCSRKSRNVGLKKVLLSNHGKRRWQSLHGMSTQNFCLQSARICISKSLDNVCVVWPGDDGDDEDDGQPLGRVHAPRAHARHAAALPGADAMAASVVRTHGHRHFTLWSFRGFSLGSSFLCSITFHPFFTKSSANVIMSHWHCISSSEITACKYNINWLDWLEKLSLLLSTLFILYQGQLTRTCGLNLDKSISIAII